MTSTFHLHVEQKIHHFAILYHVVLAFRSHLAGLFRPLLAFAGNKVVVAYGLGADEAVFKVGVDDTGGLGRRVADMYRPGAYFLDAGGEIRVQAQQPIAGANDAIQSGFVHAHVRQQIAFVFVVQVGDFGFDGGATGHDGGIFGLGVVLYRPQLRLVVKTAVQEIGHIHGGFGGDEAILPDQRVVVLVERQRTDRAAFIEIGGAHV